MFSMVCGPDGMLCAVSQRNFYHENANSASLLAAKEV